MILKNLHCVYLQIDKCLHFFLQESEIERLSSLEEELQKKSEECEELKKVL